MEAGNKRAPADGSMPPAKRPATGSMPHDEDFIDDQFDDDVFVPEPPEEIDIELGEAGRNWRRPPVPDNFSPATNALVFQQTELDYINGPVPPGIQFPNVARFGPIVRMYGVTEAGNSVCAFVYGFQPYFYIECPGSWNPDDIEDLKSTLNKQVQARGRGNDSDVAIVDIVVESKASIWQYQEGKQKRFLKIITSLPANVTAARGILENGISIAGHSSMSFVTYESSVLYALRFMIDCNVVGGNWVELPAGTWQTPQAPATFCQIEAHVHWKSLISHPPEGEYSKLAPLRILSVDIECAGRKGHFPEPNQDPVIQIASMVTVQGASQPIVRNVMTLGGCAAIVGAEVMPFDSEAQLLRRWMDLLLESDPDVIIGYNICNFDLPYLFDRAVALGISKEFHQWGRIRGSRARMKETQFSSKAHGTHEYKDVSIEGRVQLDLYMAIQRDYKLSSYSLNAVSAHFLGEQKEDVHHSAISELQNGNDETRRRLAVYCLKDAYLPQRLLDKLMYMYNYVEMARVTGVPMSYLLTRGQSIKVFSQLLRKARAKGFLVPNMKVQGAVTDGVGYEGATVLEPKIGFYEKPVATLDFASLYPSIMMAHNLCYTTLVPEHRVRELPPEHVEKTPSGEYFVRADVQKGILPEILHELLGARKRAKNDLKNETDPFKKAVLDGRQLALKISANSVYGFTGATVGKMPCLAISSSVTAYGREMIMHTRKLVMERFCRANGYETDCDVIYGDTDSVMVNFKIADVSRAMELGKEAAGFITTTFPPPVKLEFEKVYFPYLLMNKKRYAGLLWTKPEKFDKMDSKGLESVRRDNCLLVRNVITTCLEKILIDRNVDGAVSYVKQTISDLLMNKIDLSLLVISKGLTQAAEDYKNISGHVELAKRMAKRDPATAPTVGDRVPYVMIKAAKNAKAYEKTEDPIWALDHNLPIDVQYYLENHLSKPLLRLFEPVLKNPKELLSGDHTRSIFVSTPSTACGGIMRFAKVRLSCLGCKAPLSDKDSASGRSLCAHCAPKEADIYIRTLTTVGELEQQFGALWTQCQRCQGSLHQDVLCTSRDCPIFYRRKKVQKDLNEAQAQLQRFTDW